MSPCMIRCVLPLLCATLGVVTSFNANNDSEIVDRQPRVTGRIVKLYSGSKSEPIHCTEEGFKGDPLNCAVFYRCIKSGHEKYTIFRFQCGPGTIYDPETEVCNHPKSTKRSECFDNLERSSVNKGGSIENDIDNDFRQELPSPFAPNRVAEDTTVKQFVSSFIPGVSIPFRITLPPVTSPRIKHSPTTTRSVSPNTKRQEGDSCIEDGFMGDSEDCRKFYRCVANGRGGFIRYEFSCSDSTVWDDETQGCNHPWSVKRRRCGRDAGDNEGTRAQASNQDSSDSDADASTIQEQLQINYGNRVSQLQLQINNGTKVKQNQTQINYGDKVKQNQKQDNYVPSSQQMQKQISHGNAVSQSQKQVNYGDKTIQTQVQIDHSKQSSQSQQQTYLPPDPVTKPQDATSNGNGDKCTESGFMGDSKDCKKFYRCVDNGKGSYTQYEFSCGDGTVWDQNIEACNHAWAVKDCGKKPSSESPQSESSVMTTTTVKTTPSQTTLKPSSTDEGDDEPSYDSQNQDSPSSTEAAREPESEPQSTTQESASSSDDSVCKSSGFVGDPKDCKKFYRCVDNGNGKYTRYEFSCGDGTVWDQSIEGCNHEWAVKKCNDTGSQETQSQTELIQSQDTTTTTTSTESSATDTEDDQGYNQPSSETDATTSKNPVASNEDCKQEGFMGDRRDCKKFYRCVDNGKGGFTQYEFTCGEGTVWDQEIQACNHPPSNKKCDSSSSSQSQTSKAPEPENDEPNEETTTEPSKTTQASSEPGPSSDRCKSEGFYGDSKDCKKFYRCVDNGKGGYTKYDFTCGDGTVWDQEIQGCNHDMGKCKQGSSSGTTQSDQETTTKSQNEVGTTNLNTESTTTTEKSSTSSSLEDKCTSEGFYANSKDCKKFYRCVDNGKGSYTKYEFSCGEGTVWVQEFQACDHDNDVNSCSSQTNQNNNDNTQTTSENPEQQQSTSSSESQTQADEISDEGSNEPTSESDGTCSSEGFYPNKKDCRKFYRCVDNGKGGYTKYDFTCGEGTAWDSNVQACNHISEVDSCDGSTQEESQTQPGMQQESTDGTTTNMSTSGPSTESSKPSNSKDVCTKEGYFGNSDDCKKFYRCVDNGKGGYTKYDFTCGEGTIWDQDITACNHPRDVTHQSCLENETQNESSSSSPTTEGSPQSSSSTTESSQESSNCTQDNSSKKPSKGNITCDKEGFHENPNDCKKFYRCVDWDGDGKKFSVFHFDCGEGTIWDPALETCNYEDSVYPPRDCSGSQSQNENVDEETNTTEGSTSTTTEGTTTTTTEESTESEGTTAQLTTTEESTTQSSTTSQSTTQKTTTQESTNSEQTTTQQSTTSESTTTEQTTTEKTTTQETTTSEQTTQSSSTEETSTQESTTSEHTTQESTTQETTDSTTQESTTQNSTEESSDSTTESSTDGATTEQSDQTTTESSDDQSTTEQSSESEKECPETEDDQYLYVCPTGFRRHPKYCDMFYQCSEDDDTHEVKIATFNCPNNTIYDESKTQCVDEDKADKKCDGQKAQKRRFKRLHLNTKSPIVVSKQKHSCPAAGHFPFEKDQECSAAFLKCEKSKSGKLRGMVYRCPEGYVYWSVSRRCEPKTYLKNCKDSANDWSGRWEIPLERRNVAP